MSSVLVYVYLFFVRTHFKQSARKVDRRTFCGAEEKAPSFAHNRTGWTQSTTLHFGSRLRLANLPTVCQTLPCPASETTRVELKDKHWSTSSSLYRANFDASELRFGQYLFECSRTGLKVSRFNSFNILTVCERGHWTGKRLHNAVVCVGLVFGMEIGFSML